MNAEDREPLKPLPAAFVAALEHHSSCETSRQFTLPVGLAERVDRELRRIRLRRRIGAVTLIAVLTLVIGGIALYWNRPAEKAQPFVSTIEPQTPKIGESLSEAGDAFASVTRNTAEKAWKPTRSLWTETAKVSMPETKATVELPDASETFAAVPGSAKASLAPVTGGTRKAFQLFLRDTGLQRPN